jgi:hypothetical protein
MTKKTVKPNATKKKTVKLTAFQKKVIKGLNATSALLAKSDWIRNFYAKNAEGEVVNIHSVNACGFCTVGAVVHAVQDLSTQDYVESALDLQVSSLDKTADGAMAYNDDVAKDKRDILRLLKRTIKNVETGVLTINEDGEVVVSV